MIYYLNKKLDFILHPQNTYLNTHTVIGREKEMGINRLLKKIVERLPGIILISSLPRGVNIFNDIKKALPNYSLDTIFDVGANVGQSAKTYISYFPSSQIYCFEPIRKTFLSLQDNIMPNKNVNCFQIAFGSYKGKAMMLSEGTSTMNHLLNQQDNTFKINNMESEVVDILTLDAFCDDNNIEKISYLKIDTEGNDLEVLKGAESMLKKQCVDFIEVEAGMNPTNKYHVAFEILKNYLERHDYFLFGIYEQMHEWIKKELHLRRTNPVFVSQHMITLHQQLKSS
jgi:FkbM family methyltransferase